MTIRITLLKGEGRTVLIDTGTNGFDETTRKLHERDHLTGWQPPEKILAKVGVRPEEVDTVLLTHAHYDHMDNMGAFPNADFYIQEREMMGWIWAMTREKRFRYPLVSLKSQNIYDALKLAGEGRMHLVDGKAENILTGIDLLPAFDGHTFGSQIVAVHNGDDTLIFVGDVMYVPENLTGINGSGQYVPVGMAVGDTYSQMKTFDEVMKLADGRIEKIIIGHSPEIYSQYPTATYDDNLRVAEIIRTPGDASL